MTSSSSLGSYQLSIYYITTCYTESLLHAAHAISSALLLSNAIRYWVTLRLVLRLRHGNACTSYLLEIEGSRVKWLRPGENNLLGFLRTVLDGRKWPGTRLRALPHQQRPEYPEDCINAMDYAVNPSACPSCIIVDEDKVRVGLKPWWLLASIMVVNDARCRRQCT